MATASAAETEMGSAHPVQPRHNHAIEVPTLLARVVDRSFSFFVELGTVRHGKTFAEHIAINDGKKAER